MRPTAAIDTWTDGTCVGRLCHLATLRHVLYHHNYDRSMQLDRKWNYLTWWIHFCHYLPTTVGSRSTNTDRGTCFPAPVSLKNVLKESSPPPTVLSDGICPSGWIPCSRQYNSQHALPIWTPAWPTWMLIHSLYQKIDTHVGTIDEIHY